MTITIREVPRLLLAHQDYLRGVTYRTYAGEFIHSAQIAAGETAEKSWVGREAKKVKLGETFCNVQQIILAERVPLFIPTSMVLAAREKESNLDPEAPWSPALFPAPAGTMVFQDSVLFDGTDGPVSVGMIMWEWEQVSPDRQAVSIAVYTDSTDERDASMVMRAEANRDGKMPHVPIGRWHLAQFGALWTGQVAGPRPETEAVNPIDLLPRFLYTLLFLAKSKLEDGQVHTYTDKRILRLSKHKPQAVPAAVLGL